VGERGGAARLEMVGAFAAIYLIWGSTFLAIRFAIESIPPLFMASARFLLAGGLLYLWTRLRGLPRPEKRHWPAAALLGGLLLLGGNGAVSWAEQRVASGAAALIVATIPLWVALLEGLRRGGSRPGGRALFGLLLGFGGVAILVGPGRPGGLERVDPTGAAALLFASLCWAFGSLYAPRALLPASKFVSTAMQMLAGGGFLLIASLLAGEWGRLDPSAVSPRSIVSLLYLVLFGSIVSFSAYIWLLGVTTPSRVSTYAFVNPIVAVLLGWGFAGEPLGPRTLLAAAAIVGAVVLILSRPARRVPAAARPSVAPPETRAGALSQAVLPEEGT
jgi:drug/metabolite transporter (DMT)-like permease